MAKKMARLKNNIVTNIEWCSDKESESETFVNPTGYSISIGDKYIDGHFYRDGQRVLSEVEILEQKIEELRIKISELTSSPV